MRRSQHPIWPDAEQAATKGAQRAAHENLGRLSALMRFCSTCRFTMRIPADPAAIPIVTDGVGELMEEKHWPKEDVFAVQLALQEAVANAIRHGCRGDVSKHLRCSISSDESGELVIVVRDPGPGFDPSAIADPLDAANILKPSGRGIFLINELMDHVQFGRQRARGADAEEEEVGPHSRIMVNVHVTASLRVLGRDHEMAGRAQCLSAVPRVYDD